MAYRANGAVNSIITHFCRSFHAGHEIPACPKGFSLGEISKEKGAWMTFGGQGQLGVLMKLAWYNRNYSLWT